MPSDGHAQHPDPGQFGLCGAVVRRSPLPPTEWLRQGRGKWLRSPLIYTLSLSIYCTAWTFYGAVGNAARSGLEYRDDLSGPDAW